MAEKRIPLLIRIPTHLKAALAELAVREHRSLNQQIEFLLHRAVQAETKPEVATLSAPVRARRQKASET
jgi:hypothetical protein